MAEDDKWCITAREEHQVGDGHELRNVDYDDKKNVIYLTTSEGITAYDGDIAASKLTQSSLASQHKSQIRCQYIPDCGRLLFSDGENFNVRGYYDNICLLDTAMHTQVSSPSEEIELHMSAMTLEKFIEGIQYRGGVTMNNDGDEVVKVLKPQRKFRESKQMPRSVDWQTFKVKKPMETLVSAFRHITNELKQRPRDDYHDNPGLSIAAVYCDMAKQMWTDPAAPARVHPIKENMYSEANRLASFKGRWPHDFPNATPEEMAKAGFYLDAVEHNPDRSMCFTCSVCLVCWERDDYPFVEHQKHQSDCPFMKGKPTNNVSIASLQACQPATAHKHVDIVYGQCGPKTYLASLRPDCATVDIWELATNVQQMQQIPCLTDAGKVTALCLFSFPSADQPNQHNLYLATASTNTKQQASIVLRRTNAKHPRKEVQEPPSAERGMLVESTSDYIQQIQLPAPYNAGYDITHVLLTVNGKSLLVYATSERPGGVKDRYAALFCYQIHSNNQYECMLLQNPLVYSIARRDDAVRDIYQLSAAFSTMRCGETADNHIIIATQSGAVKLLGLQKLKELCVYQDDNHTVISTTFCTGLDRVLAITKQGKMVNLHISPVTVDISIRMDKPIPGIDKLLDDNLTLSSLKKLIDLTESEPVNFRDREPAGFSVYITPNRWSHEVNDPQVSEKEVNSAVAPSKKKELEAKHLSRDTQIWKFDATSGLNTDTDTIEISLPKRNVLSHVAIKLHITPSSKSFPRMKMALVRYIDDKNKKGKKAPTVRNSENFISDQELQANNMELLCTPIDVSACIDSSGRTAVVYLTSPALLQMQLRSIVVVIKSLDTNQYGYRGSRDSDKPVDELKQIFQPVIKPLRGSEDNRRGGYGDDRKKSQMISYMEVTVRQARKADQIDMMGRLKMIDHDGLLKRLLKVAGEGLRDPDIELEPIEYSQVTAMSILSWICVLQTLETKQRDYNNTMLPAVAASIESLVMSNLIKGTRETSGAFSQLLSLWSDLALSRGFRDELRTLGKTVLHSMLKHLGELMHCPSSGSIKNFFSIVSRLQTLDSAHVAETVSRNLHQISSKFTDLINDPENQAPQKFALTTFPFEREGFTVDLPKFLMTHEYIPTQPTALSTKVDSLASREPKPKEPLPPVDMMNISKHGLNPGEQLNARMCGLSEVEPLQYSFRKHSENIYITKGNPANASPTFYGSMSSSMPDPMLLTDGYPTNVKQVAGSSEKEYIRLKTDPTALNEKPTNWSQQSSELILKPPHEFTLLSSRGCPTERRFAIMDFGQPVRVTDIVLPSIPEATCITIDAWLAYDKDKNPINKQRVAVILHDVTAKATAMQNIQPPLVVRYVQVFCSSNPTSAYSHCFKIPTGAWYGHSVVFPWETDDEDVVTLRSYSDVLEQIKVYKAACHDILVNYDAACTRLKRYFDKHAAKDASTNTDKDNKEIQALESDCLGYQQQHTIALSAVRRLERVLMDEARDSSEQSRICLDKIRFLIELSIETLIMITHSQKIPDKLYLALPAPEAKKLLLNLCVNGSRRMQILGGNLIVKVCSEQIWFGQLFGTIISELFVPGSQMQFSRVRFFNLLVSMAQRAVDASKENSKHICGRILEMLSSHLAPLHESTGGAVDATVVSWLLLFLARMLDTNYTSGGSNSWLLLNRWEFLTAERNLSKKSVHNSSTDRQRVKKAREMSGMRRSMGRPRRGDRDSASSSRSSSGGSRSRMPAPIQYLMERAGLRDRKLHKMRRLEMEDMRPPPARTVSSGTAMQNTQMMILDRQTIEPVVQGLLALVLKVNSSCHSDMFVLACKVLSRTCTSCQPSLELRQIASQEQITQLMRNMTSRRTNVNGAGWGGEWVRHSLKCLLQDLIEAELASTDFGSDGDQSMDVDEPGFPGGPSDDPYDDMGMHPAMMMMGPPGRRPRDSDRDMRREMMMMMEEEMMMMGPPGRRGDMDREMRREMMMMMMMGGPRGPMGDDSDDEEDDRFMRRAGMGRYDPDVTRETKPQIMAPISGEIMIASRSRLGATAMTRENVWRSDELAQQQKSLTVIPTSSGKSRDLKQSAGFPDEGHTAPPTPIPQNQHIARSTQDALKVSFDTLLTKTTDAVDLESFLTVYLELNFEYQDSAWRPLSNQKATAAMVLSDEAVIQLIALINRSHPRRAATWVKIFHVLSMNAFSTSLAEKLASADRLPTLITSFITSGNDPIGKFCLEPFTKFLVNLESSYPTGSAKFDNNFLATLNAALKRNGAYGLRKDALVELLELMAMRKSSPKYEAQHIVDFFKILVNDFTFAFHQGIDDLGGYFTVELEGQTEQAGDANPLVRPPIEVAAIKALGNRDMDEVPLYHRILVKGFYFIEHLLQQMNPQQTGSAGITDTSKIFTGQRTDEQKQSPTYQRSSAHGHRMDVDVPANIDSKILNNKDEVYRMLVILGESNYPAFQGDISAWKTKEQENYANSILMLLIRLFRNANDYDTMVQLIVKYAKNLDGIKLHFSIEVLIRVALKCEDVVSRFIELEGIGALTRNLIKSFNASPDKSPSVITTVLNYMSHSQSAYQDETNKNSDFRPGDIIYGDWGEQLINFAPLGIVEAPQPTVTSSYGLNTLVRGYRRSTSMALVRFKDGNTWVDLTLLLPIAVLIKEIRMDQVPINNPGPSHISVELSHDGLPVLPASQPILTSGISSVRLKFQEPQVASRLLIRVHKQTGSTTIGLSQIHVLGYPGLIDPTKKLHAPPPPDSLNWMLLLHHCLTQIPSLKQRVLAAIDDESQAELMNTCIALLFSDAGKSYKRSIEKVVTLLALKSVQSSSVLIDRLLRHNYQGLLLGRTGLTATESTADIIYRIACQPDPNSLKRVEQVLSWLDDCARHANSGRRNAQLPSGISNPSFHHIQCLVITLQHHARSSQRDKTMKLIKDDLFKAIGMWSSSMKNVTNNPAKKIANPTKKGIDNVIAAMCDLQPDLFRQLLQKFFSSRLPVISASEIRNASVSDEMKDTKQQEMLTDEVKTDCTVNPEMFISEPSLAILAACCQIESCVRMLINSSLPRILSQAVFDYFNKHTAVTAASSICLTPDSLLIVLNFFTECVSNSSLFKDWIGMPEGSKFWFPLLTSCDKGNVSSIEGMIEAISALFKQLTINHPLNQERYAFTICAVLRESKRSLSNFMNNLILTSVIEDEQIYVSLTAHVNVVFDKSRDSNSMHIRNGLAGETLTVKVKVTRTLRSLIRNYIKEPTSKAPKFQLRFRYTQVDGTASSITLDEKSTLASVLTLLTQKGHLGIGAEHIVFQIFPHSSPSTETGYARAGQLYSTTLKLFTGMNGLTMLAERLPLLSNDLSSSKPIQLMVEGATGEKEIHTMPNYSLLCLSLFLRLPGYSKELISHGTSAKCMLRLVLGVKEDWDNLTADMAPEIPTLPFQILTRLYQNQPLHTDDGLALRKTSFENGILHTVLAALSVLAHNDSSHKFGGTHDALVKTVTRLAGQVTERYKPSTSRSRREGLHGNTYWAKGTGFGSGSTSEQYDLNQMRLKQAQEEAHEKSLLDVVASFLSSAGTSQALPEQLHKLLEDSCLLTCLGAHLRTNSILDIQRHIPLYKSVIAVVRSMTSLTETVRLLSLQIPDKPNIQSLLNNIYKSMSEYQQKLSGGDSSRSDVSDDQTAALNQLSEIVKSTTKEVNKAVESYNSKLKKLSPKKASSPSKPKTASEVYEFSLKDLQYDDCAIVENTSTGIFFKQPHHYESQVRQSGSAASNPNRMRRIVQEANALANGLPLSDSSSIFVRTDSERADVMKVLITGPEDTPYMNGCFLFDVFFPTDFPNSPPLVNLETTGGQKIRFNPNLYNDGKVCLSILNTWHGRPEEKWNAANSTFLQVLVSIQSLILVPEPYYNEPGYERSRGTPEGMANCREYDSNIRQATVKHGMLEMLTSGPACFKEVIHKHFWLKRKEIKNQIENWLSDQDMGDEPKLPKTQKVYQTIAQHNAMLKHHYQALLHELSVMKPPKGLENMPSVDLSESPAVTKVNTAVTMSPARQQPSTSSAQIPGAGNWPSRSLPASVETFQAAWLPPENLLGEDEDEDEEDEDDMMDYEDESGEYL